jgi:hypothetical protein
MSKLEQLRALGDAKRARSKSPVGKVATHNSHHVGPVDRKVLTTTGAVAAQPAGDAKTKKGRPRLGEVRDKPWTKTKPPMSKTTWYRRRKETQQ